MSEADKVQMLQREMCSRFPLYQELYLQLLDGEIIHLWTAIMAKLSLGFANLLTPK